MSSISQKYDIVVQFERHGKRIMGMRVWAEPLVHSHIGQERMITCAHEQETGFCFYYVLDPRFDLSKISDWLAEYARECRWRIKIV